MEHNGWKETKDHEYQQLSQSSEMNLATTATLRTRTWRKLERTAIEWKRPPDHIFMTAYAGVTRRVPEVTRIGEDVKQIRHRIEQEGQRKCSVDYEQESLAFNQAYFFRNFYKCLCLLAFEGIPPSAKYLADLGAGAGPFALAAGLVCRKQFKRVTMIDESAAQLSLGRNIYDEEALSYVKLINARLFGFVPPQEFFRIASFWLCETELFRSPSLWEMCALSGPGALIIDYRDVLEELASSLDHSPFRYRLISLSVVPTLEVASKLEKDNVTIHGLRIYPKFNR